MSYQPTPGSVAARVVQVLLAPDEVRQLVHYLDRMAEVEA